MVKVIIGHRPELTAEVARKVFESHFHDNYDCRPSAIMGHKWGH